MKVPSQLDDLLTPGGLARHRDRTIPYLRRHAAYHVLDHAWEMQDRDLTGDASGG